MSDGLTRRQFGFVLLQLIVRSESPADFETPVNLLDKSWITPNDVHYVRTHLPTPAIRPNEWSLTIDGEVNRPLKLSMNDIRGFREVTQAVTLECSGNGRAFADPPVAGLQWEKGAVGTARWTGVSLRDVLTRAQLKAGAKHLVLNGADTPLRTMPDFIRSIPVEKAMHADTLLAYRMNGEDIPLNHGFPLRLIVPGWEAAASTKWLTDIRVSESEAPGFFMQTAYRVPNRSVAPGAAVDAKDMVTYTRLDVKSIFTHPLDGAMTRTGSPIELRGFAWAGEADVVRVDISTDFGRTWTAAVLDNEKAKYAWRRFRYTWKPMQRGSFVAVAKATDSQGRTQPVVASWNPSGYMYNVVDKVRINVED
jgi:sulfite oxidase